MIKLSNFPHNVATLIERFEETIRLQQQSFAKNKNKVGDIKEHAFSQAIQKFKKFLTQHFHNLPQEYYPKLHNFIQSIMSQSNHVSVIQLMTEAKQNLDDYIDWQVDDDRLYQHFQNLNSQYQYFTHITPSLIQVFQNLIHPLRFQMKNFESQHAYPDEKIFFESAYKLMAIMIDENHIDQSYSSLCNHMDEIFNNRSMHDFFLIDLQNLPIKKSLKRFPEWLVLFHKDPKFWQLIKLFSKNANGIEDAVPEETPFTFETIRDAELTLNYPRAVLDPDFAKLCKEYNVSQTTFDECIDIIQSGWPKKTKDNLPNLVIGDDEHNYFWVKLPVDDKRSMILGYITDCCQSIGGDSHTCVIDGLSRANNGFYVLLHRIKNDGSAPLLPTNPPQINYTSFRIVAQSYAWISRTGNLCLDSFEAVGHVLSCFDNLRNSTQARNIESLLSEFAQMAIQQDTSINRVVLGIGGKTPKNLFKPNPAKERTIAVFPEMMLEGHDYGDAKYQYRIASRLIMTAQQQLKLIDLAGIKKEEFTSKNLSDLQLNQLALFKYLLESSKQINVSLYKLERLIHDFPEFKTQLTVSKLPRLFQKHFKFDLDILHPLNPEELQQRAVNPLQLAWHLSHIPTENWPNYLKSCSPGMLDKLLTWRDEHSHSLLSYTNGVPELFSLFLSHLNPQEKYDIALETNAIHSISALHQLMTLLEGLNPEQTFSLLANTNSKGENGLFNLVKFPELFTYVWTNLDNKEKKVLINQIDAQEKCVLFHPSIDLTTLDSLLKEVTTTQKVALMTDKNLNLTESLSEISHKPEQIIALFKDLNSEQTFAVLSKTNRVAENALFSLIFAPDALDIIWQNLDDTQKYQLLAQLNKIGVSVLFHPKADPSAIKTLLKNLSHDQKFSLLMEEDLDLAEVLNWIIKKPRYAPEHMQDNIQEYLPEHVQEHVHEHIFALFDGLSTEQIFALLSKTNEEDENALFSLVAEPDILNTIWQDLSASQKQQLLAQVDCLNVSVLFHPTAESSAIQKLLDNLSTDQKFELLMSEKLDLNAASSSITEKPKYLPVEIQGLIDQDKPKRITSLFNGFSPEQKLQILLHAEVYDYKFDFLLLKDDTLLHYIFDDLNASQRLTFFKKFTDFLSSAAHFPEKIYPLIECLSTEQIAELLTLTLDDEHYPYYYILCNFPEVLKILLERVTPNEKFTILTTKHVVPPPSTLLEYTKKNLEVFDILFKDLSAAQIDTLVKDKNRQGKSVLELLKPKSEAYQIILKAQQREFISNHGIFSSVAHLPEVQDNKLTRANLK